jgi:hypothetical protein
MPRMIAGHRARLGDRAALGAAAFVVCACLVAAGAANLVAHAPGQARPDDSVDWLLRSRFGFTTAQIAALQRGVPVAALLPSRVDREVAVGGAIRIRAAADRLLALLQDVERLESGPGFLHTKKLSDPPRLEDFADLQLPPADIAALRACRPGRCEVKLGEGVFDLLKQVDWSAPDAAARVNQLARQTSLAYIDAYRRGGDTELAVYRDSDRPQFIAAEFEAMVGRAQLWPDALRPLAAYLVGYPSAPRPESTRDFFYWSLAAFGLKPVLRLNHVITYSTDSTVGPVHAVAVKQLYASHYFHTALEMRALVADGPTGGAVYLVILNMARSDGLSGVFGGLVKSKVRTASREGLERALAGIKRMAEGE